MEESIQKTPAEKGVAAQENTLGKGVLRTSDAIAQSVALLALVMGVALSTSFAATFAGAAAPLAFVVAGLGSLCLGYVVIRFTRRMASVGGVYTYISQGLGPAAGFIGGWMYAGAFAIGIAFTMAIASVYLSTVLGDFHITFGWLRLYVVLLVVLFLFVFFSIRVSTRTQLVLAALGVLAVLLLAIIILAKGGDAGISLIPFSFGALPQGISGLFFATVFSFTSFIGFESAASLGVETANPRAAIPRAILTAVIVAVVFYVFVTYAFSIGYGVSHANKWANDPAALDTLANRYSNPVLATIIDLMVAAGAFIASLAGLNLTARVLYAMGREGGLPSVFGRTHARFKSPWVGVVVAVLITLILGVTVGRSFGLAYGPSSGPFTFFGFLATAASLGILLTYILVAISGIVFFLRSRQDKGITVVADVILPVIAVLLCGATIFYTVFPTSPASPPISTAPMYTGIWLVLGLVLLAALWFTNREKVRQFGKTLSEGE